MSNRPEQGPGGGHVTVLTARMLARTARPVAPLPLLVGPQGNPVHLVARRLRTAAPKDSGDAARGYVAVRREAQVPVVTARFTLTETAYGEAPARVVSILEGNGQGQLCTVIAAADRPWQPGAAAAALSAPLAQYPNAKDGSLDARVVARPKAGDSEALHEIIGTASYIGDTPMIVCHAASGTTLGRRLEPLETALTRYFPLLTCAAVTGPIKELKAEFPMFRESAANSYLYLTPYRLRDHADHAARALAATPSALARGEGEIEAWIGEVLTARCGAQWPYPPEIHHLAREFGAFLAGFGDADALAAMIGLSEDLQGAVRLEREETALARIGTTQALGRAKVLAVQLAEANGQIETERAGAARSAAQAEIARSQLASTRSEYEILARELAEASSEIARLRAADAGRLTAQVGELQSTIDSLSLDLDAARRAAAFTRPDPGPGSPAPAPAPAPIPGTWAELAERAAGLEHVHVPASALETAAKELAHHEQTANWVERAWAALEALEAYAARHGAEYPSFWHYISKHPQAKITAKHLRANESASVRANPRMRAARTFPTPLGRVTMFAHIDVGGNQPPAPRLYFFDACARDGKIYVGLIGPHPVNTLTN